MAENKATTKQTSDSIAFFLKLSQTFDIDEDGFVVYAADPEKRAMIKGTGASDPKRALAIYQQKMPPGSDYYTVNPYAEGLGLTTPPNSFFYSTLRGDLTGRLVVIVQGVVMFMMNQKNIPVPESEYTIMGTPKVLLDIASTKDAAGKPIFDLVDEKTLNNIKSFLLPSTPGKPGQKSALRDLAYVAYTKNMMTASLKIDLITDPNFQDNTDTKKMRKSDFQVLRGILMGALKLNDPSEIEKFTSSAVPEAPPKMSSWLGVLFQVYRQINPALQAVSEDCVVPLGEFDHHLKMLPAYYLNARWQVQTAVGTPAEVTPGIPGSMQSPMPQATSQVPSVPQPGYGQPAQPAAPGAMVMPGIIRADGTVAPPQAVNAYGTPYYQPATPGMPAPLPVNQYGQQPGYGQPGVPNYPQGQPGYPQPLPVGYPQGQPGVNYAGYPQQAPPMMGYPQAMGYPQPMTSGNPPFYGLIAGGAAGGGAGPVFTGVR